MRAKPQSLILNHDSFIESSIASCLTAAGQVCTGVFISLRETPRGGRYSLKVITWDVSQVKYLFRTPS